MDHADHSQFQFAAERYVLGELSEPEALAFEEHFFSCEGCAQDVEDLTAIRLAAPAVLPGLRRADERKQGDATRGRFALPWFARPWVPQFALGAFALLAAFTGYQNAVQIPGLRAAAGETLQVSAAPATLTAQRGTGKSVFSASQRSAPLLIANEWPEKFPTYEARIGQFGKDDRTMHARAETGDASLLVSVPASKLGAGDFELKIFGIREGNLPQLVARYPFTIQGKNQR